MRFAKSTTLRLWSWHTNRYARDSFWEQANSTDDIQGILHRRFHSPSAVQMCTLMNIKTGGCSEDCSYCAQSSRYSTGLKATKMSPVDEVLSKARIAKDNGSTRFCMGAAWRDMRGRKTSLKNVKAMVEGIRGMDMEVCVTLGMIDQNQV